MSRRSAVASGALLLLVLWLAVARLGLAAHDVLLVESYDSGHLAILPPPDRSKKKNLRRGGRQ